jgi:hypothetical protein
MKCLNGCPLCYSGMRGRRAYPGHRSCVGAPIKRGTYVDPILPSRRARPGSGDVAGSWVPCELSARYPTLVGWLVSATYADGATRTTGTMLITFDAGWFKAWLHDRDGAASAWITAPALTSLLELADRVLCGEEGQWRPDPPKGGQRPGRRG